MEENSKQFSTRVVVATRDGLHARPASQIAMMISGRDVKLTIVRTDTPDSRADGSSVLDMLILAACKGTELELITEGPEARDVLDEVAGFFQRNFDEEKSEPL